MTTEVPDALTYAFECLQNEGPPAKFAVWDDVQLGPGYVPIRGIVFAVYRSRFETRYALLMEADPWTNFVSRDWPESSLTHPTQPR